MKTCKIRFPERSLYESQKGGQIDKQTWKELPAMQDNMGIGFVTCRSDDGAETSLSYPAGETDPCSKLNHD